VDRIQNRALFEIPDILARVLAESGEEAADGAVTRPADQRRPAQFA
jgi:hypothetical protein